MRLDQMRFAITALFFFLVVFPAGAGEVTPPGQVPFQFGLGQALFRSHCAECHGEWAGGTDKGPPLLHDYYKPSHHGDGAFYLAVERGVRAHHWGFGNMPPIKGVAPNQIQQIVRFIRWWQRQNGIR